MTTSTIKNRTKKAILTQEGAINKNVVNMLDRCIFAGNKVYTGYYSGSGRFTTAHSASHTITWLLGLNGYKWEMGNDAPRGGVSGEYVKVSKQAMKFLREVYSLKNN